MGDHTKTKSEWMAAAKSMFLSRTDPATGRAYAYLPNLEEWALSKPLREDKRLTLSATEYSCRLCLRLDPDTVSTLYLTEPKQREHAAKHLAAEKGCEESEDGPELESILSAAFTTSPIPNSPAIPSPPYFAPPPPSLPPEPSSPTPSTADQPSTSSSPVATSRPPASSTSSPPPVTARPPTSSTSSPPPATSRPPASSTSSPPPATSRPPASSTSSPPPATSRPSASSASSPPPATSRPPASSTSSPPPVTARPPASPTTSRPAVSTSAESHPKENPESKDGADVQEEEKAKPEPSPKKSFARKTIPPKPGRKRLSAQEKRHRWENVGSLESVLITEPRVAAGALDLTWDPLSLLPLSYLPSTASSPHCSRSPTPGRRREASLVSETGSPSPRRGPGRPPGRGRGRPRGRPRGRGRGGSTRTGSRERMGTEQRVGTKERTGKEQRTETQKKLGKEKRAEMEKRSGSGETSTSRRRLVDPRRQRLEPGTSSSSGGSTPDVVMECEHVLPERLFKDN